MCTNCNDIEINIGGDGYNGWSPELAVSEDCTGKSVLQLISWVNGTGEKPSFGSDIMTDAWLLLNPIYLGEDGFTDTCDEAVDITGDDGATGATGPTGEQGNDGDPGADGCDPNITITAQVSGGEGEPYNVTVTGPGAGAPCDPEYNLIFPIEMITENTEITTAIDAAVLAALTTTQTRIDPVSISTGPSSNVKYTMSSGIGSVTASLSGSSGDSWITHYQMGNIMTVNFRLRLTFGGTGAQDCNLEIKIPNSKTCVNDDYSNSISVYSGNFDGSFVSNRYPIISSNASSGNTYLKIGWHAELADITVIAGMTATFMGQISFAVT